MPVEDPTERTLIVPEALDEPVARRTNPLDETYGKPRIEDSVEDPVRMKNPLEEVYPEEISRSASESPGISPELSSEDTSEVSSEGDFFETSQNSPEFREMSHLVEVAPAQAKAEPLRKRMAAAVATQVVEAKEGVKEVGGEVGQRMIDSEISASSFGNIAAPMVGGAFSVLQAGLSIHAEKIVNERILNTQRLLLSASAQKPFQAIHSEEELVMHLDPLEASSVREATLQSMHYAQQKMESRASKLRFKQIGSGIALGSTVLAATGVGAVVGGAGALVATAVSLAPEAYGTARSFYKRYQGTKGVARKKASQLIWGLGLERAISSGLIERSVVQSDPDAKAASEHIEMAWGTVHSQDDLEESKQIASKFLEGLKVVSFSAQADPQKKFPLSMEKFATKKGLAKIMSRFKSTPGG